ncbi:MAG: Hsp20/alpha crystallin family protein [Chloroflexota bacterium]|nr:Hsp20/alpha crystallin family protein [Chloroflexota bacterium]
MTTFYMTPHQRARIRRYPTSDQIARFTNYHQCDINVPLDIKEEQDTFTISATLPGLDVEDLNIEIIKNIVDISGEFKNESDEDAKYLRQERPVGEFHRRLRFPNNLESENAEATLDNGILTLQIPKVKEEQPKIVKVIAK